MSYCYYNELGAVTTMLLPRKLVIARVQGNVEDNFVTCHAGCGMALRRTITLALSRVWRDSLGTIWATFARRKDLG